MLGSKNKWRTVSIHTAMLIKQIRQIQDEESQQLRIATAQTSSNKVLLNCRSIGSNVVI